MMQRYSPPCVVIDEKHNVLYYSTRTARYLSPPVGEPTQDILRMAHDDLRPALRAAIHKALTSQETAVYANLKVQYDNSQETITLRVEPLNDPAAVKGLAMVIFEANERQSVVEPILQPTTFANKGEGEQIIAQLEEQLRINNEELQATVERLESSNEELMSMNEEFQSTNEELETSKEELQALNEELVTVNAELESKIEELAQANDATQNLLASSEIATLFLDRQFQVKFFTAAIAEIFNLIDADIGRPLRHLAGKFTYPELVSDAESVLKNLVPIEREITTDDQRHYLMRMLPYRTREDQIDGVVVTMTEITARRKAEEFRARLAAIVEASTDAIIGLTIDGTITSWNPGAEQIYGYSAKEMVGEPIKKIVPGDRHEELQEIFAKLKAGRHIRNLETVRVGKGDTSIQVALTTSPIFNQQGEVIAVASIARDISLEKQQQQELAESLALQKKRAEEIEALMESVPAAVWIATDPQCKNIVGNRAAYETLRSTGLSNLSKSAPAGEAPTNFRVMKDGRELAPDELPMQLAARTGKPVLNFEEEILFEDQTRISIFGNSIPLLDDDGQPRGAVAAFIDVTRLKNVEETLRQSEKMQAIGKLAGGIAHNFNNNLAIIIGNLELARLKLADNPEVRQNIDYAHLAARRSGELVKKILTFSRADIHPKHPISIATLLDETLQILKSTTPSTIEVVKTVPDEDPNLLIEADPAQIHETLLNLCSNAIDAMDEKGVLRVDLKYLDLKERVTAGDFECAPGRYACLKVGDTGVGMSEETQERIFDPFFTTKQPGKGTGIGLSAVHGVVQQHGGMIKVQSQPGKGSTFELYFPLFTGNRPADLPATSALPKGDEHILIVDDEKLLVKAMLEMLAEMGYQVTVAGSGDEALELISADPRKFDLVITDQTMPGMTGKELILEVKKQQPKLPFILCTGYSTKSTPEEAKQIGAAAYFVKPIEMPSLLTMVRDVLDRA